MVDTAKEKRPIVAAHDIPDDIALPGLLTLLDPERVLAAIGEAVPSAAGQLSACRIPYVRYKPRTNCLVSYTVEFEPKGGGAKVVWLSGKCYTESGFKTAVRKNKGHSFESVIGLTEPIILERERIVIFPAERDPLMEGLETAFDSRKLIRLFHSHLEKYPRELWRISDRKCKLDFIRFKPEKRAVLRLETKAVNRQTGGKEKVEFYVRAYADSSGDQLHKLMNDLRKKFEGNPSLGVADSLAGIKRKRLVVVDKADGVPLDTTMKSAGIADRVERVGHALALLHTFRSTRVPVRPIRETMRDFSATALSLKALIPESMGVIDRLMTVVNGLKPKGRTSSAGFVHGDFHPGQVLIDGDKVIILDFDRAHIGDPACDIGNFLAYLHYENVISNSPEDRTVVRSFTDSYSETTDCCMETGRIRFWEIVGLFQLAVLPFRTQRPCWREEIKSILDRCLRL